MTTDATKTRDQLLRCLKAVHMGIWEGFLVREPFGPKDFQWDQEVRRMHGMSEDETMSPIDWFLKVGHPEDIPRMETANRYFLEEGHRSGTLDFTYRIRWPNGEIRYIEMHAIADVENPNANEIKVYGVSKDITAEVVKQKFIDDQKNRLLSNSRMAVLGELSGGIAHEINNPLTVIQARSFQLLQMAEQGQLDAGKIKSAADSISKTGDKIAKIIKSLRAFAHGQDDEPVDLINVYQLVEQTLDFCKVRFYNHGIDIRIGDIPKDLEFECHLVQLEEALLNLFNNAHDAISGMSKKWILIEAFDKGSDIEIHITDSGPGIPDAIAESMMLPFFSTKEIGKGSGLGLCIVSEIITKHHGAFHLDRASVNTKFIIRLPKFQPGA